MFLTQRCAGFPVSFTQFLCNSNFRRTLQSDNGRADACFRLERRGDCCTEALTTATFSGPVVVRERPVDLRFNEEPVCLKFDTQLQFVFLSGTGSCGANVKVMLR